MKMSIGIYINLETTHIVIAILKRLDSRKDDLFVSKLKNSENNVLYIINILGTLVDPWNHPYCKLITYSRLVLKSAWLIEYSAYSQT